MRTSSRPTTETRQAETQNTARQPNVPDMNSATGRASMMPVSTPAMMLPTSWPRRSSGMRCATKSSSTCAPVAHRPIRNDATKKVGALPDVARPTSPATVSPIRVSTSRLFLMKSAAGTRKNSPVPYPICATLTINPAASGEVCSSVPMEAISGCA